MRAFPMCYHPELAYRYLIRGMGLSIPTKTIGSCPEHNYICPVCGFGRGSLPPCHCNDKEKKGECS